MGVPPPLASEAAQPPRPSSWAQGTRALYSQAEPGFLGAGLVPAPPWKEAEAGSCDQSHEAENRPGPRASPPEPASSWPRWEDGGQGSVPPPRSGQHRSLQARGGPAELPPGGGLPGGGCCSRTEGRGLSGLCSLRPGCRGLQLKAAAPASRSLVSPALLQRGRAWRRKEEPQPQPESQESPPCRPLQGPPRGTRPHNHRSRGSGGVPAGPAPCSQRPARGGHRRRRPPSSSRCLQRAQLL